MNENNTGQDLYNKAKRLIPGGTMLLSKRPEIFVVPIEILLKINALCEIDLSPGTIIVPLIEDILLDIIERLFFDNNFTPN